MDSKPPLEASATPWYRRPELLLIGLIGLLYVIIIGRYRAYDLDNIWFLSFSHTFWVRHLQTDTFMLDHFPRGMGGVVVFGKLAAFVQGAILSHTGWTLTSATLISIAFILLALLCLADVSRRLGHTTGFTLCFIAFVGLTEPFVQASQKTRYEFLPIFFVSLALCLASRRFLATAMFVAAMSAEIEPAAIVVPCTVLIFIVQRLLAQQPRPLRLSRQLVVPVLRILLAAAAAAIAYSLLHPDFISIFRAADMKAVQSSTFPGGFAGTYYIHLHRHIPEFLLLLAAFAVSLVSRRRLLLDWPALCVFTGILVSALLGWGNPAYISFLSPFLCLFILQVFHTPARSRWILAAILLVTLPQYAYRYYFWASRHAGFSQREDTQIDDAIARAAARLGKTPSQLNLLGNYNLWYAHPNRFINLDRRVVTTQIPSQTDLILCFDKPLDPLVDPLASQEMPCRQLDAFPFKTVETLNLHGNQLELRLPPRQP